MHALAVDDKQLALNAIARILSVIDPSGSFEGVHSAQAALKSAQEAEPDVVFLDIEMPGGNGLELAEKLNTEYPNTNIIFVTAHDEYALKAHSLFPSAFLLKPINEASMRKALENLRHPVAAIPTGSRLYVRCFGNFDVYAPDGAPLRFKRNKTKELFAYLVDQNGARCSIGEVISALWEDGSRTPSRRAQVRNMISDLRSTLAEVDSEDILIRSRDEIAVDTEAFDCDYYILINRKKGQPGHFPGRYMSQYSWAEPTAAMLWQKERGHALPQKQ